MLAFREYLERVRCGTSDTLTFISKSEKPFSPQQGRVRINAERAMRRCKYLLDEIGPKVAFFFSVCAGYLGTILIINRKYVSTLKSNQKHALYFGT